MALGDTSIKLNAGSRTLAQVTGYGNPHAGGSRLSCTTGRFSVQSGLLLIRSRLALHRDLSTIESDGRTIADY